MSGIRQCSKFNVMVVSRVRRRMMTQNPSFYEKLFSFGIDRKSKPSNTINLYILKLEGERYYVGQSKYSDKRISKHFKGKGSAWTKEHKPVEIIKVWDSGLTNWKEAEKEECKITLELMMEYGWKNVRGGYWSNVDAIHTHKNLLHHREFIKSFGFDFKKFE